MRHENSKTVRRRCDGFTIIELLVAITIISLLIALLLPAVQQALMARRAACKNNLKQIGLALHNYESSYQRFPIGGRAQHVFGPSWWVGILPHLEQGPLFSQFDMNSPNNGYPTLTAANGKLVDGVKIGTMLCPSSPLPTTILVGNYNLTRPSYVGIAGATNDGGFDETRVSACCVPVSTGQISAGGFLIPNASLHMNSISDGVSNTIAVSEASNYAIDATGNKKDIDGSFPVGWITGTSASGIPPNYNPGFGPACWNITTIRYAPNSRDYNRPGIRDNHGPNNPLMSAHSGGVHCLLADGSVRFVGENIDLLNLKRLARRDDGVTVGDF